MHTTATRHKPIDLATLDPNAGPIGNPAPPEQIEQWIEQFHRDGYLVLHDVIPPELIQPLKDDLDRVLNYAPKEGAVAELAYRLFETSKANLALFELEPVVTFAEKLLKYDAHVVHNNSFRTPRGGGIAGWHQDDPPMYLVTEGEPPQNVRLPVMLFTANYYLTDVEDAKYGTTEVIPGSHLFGAPPPVKMEGSKWESQIVPCVGRAGTVVMFNNQVWHRGGPNQTDRVRYITQVSYGRRIIGHRYFPFMNYVMPEHVHADVEKKNPRKKKLLGFLPTGPYG